MSENPNPERWWRHRRRLAYWAMSMLTIMTILGMLGKVPSGTTPLLETVAWVFGIVIVSYFGGNAAEALASRKR